MQCCKMWEQIVIVKEEETDLVVALDCDGNHAVFVDSVVDNLLVAMLPAAVDMLVGVVFGTVVVVGFDMLVGVAVDMLVGVADSMLADVLQFAATNGLSSYLRLALQLGAVVLKSSDPSLELCQSTVVHSVLVAAVVDAVAAAVAVGTWKSECMDEVKK